MECIVEPTWKVELYEIVSDRQFKTSLQLKMVKISSTSCESFSKTNYKFKQKTVLFWT